MPLLAAEYTEEELERWFEEEGAEQPYQDRGGSEQLEFISPVEDRQTPFSRTWLEITPQSLDTGWVGITQCHDGLDAVPDAEVVYRFREMRSLRITESIGIAQAWVEGKSVQIKNVGRDARLCVELEAKVLKRMGNGRYRIRYGPFQRRFLDSYFPLHVAMRVQYPRTLLQFQKVLPAPSDGFTLKEEENHITLNAWFRGKLVIELQFAKGK